MQLASLMYGFAVIDGRRFGMGLQIGAEWAKAVASLLAGSGGQHWTDRASEDGYAPVARLRLTARPADRWLINVQGQHLDADWGDFGDYGGSIRRANAVAEYRFTDSFGLLAGYEWYRREVGGDFIEDGIVGWDQRFKGPVAGVTPAS